MSYKSSILSPNGKPFVHSTPPGMKRMQAEFRKLKNQLRSKYDAAQDGEAFINHWANSDSLTPNNSANYTVRRKLRNRSRYEVIENGSYLKGMFLTICNDFVGTGPKLQLVGKDITPDLQRKIERDFLAWCKAIRYRNKLWRMRLAKGVDGESIKVAYTHNNLENQVKLNFEVVESERLTTHGSYTTHQDNTADVDGIRYDKYSNPLFYHILDGYPGDSTIVKGRWEKAKDVIHWFRQDRGWLRGIPEITPSLNLCALLRRYTLAVVKAAETAANFAAVLETEGPASGLQYTDSEGNLLEDDPFDMFPIEQGMFVTLPWNTKLNQLDAKQPTTNYDDFVNMLLREISRPLLVPFNYASGSSADSNMASAIVDAHIYKEGIKQERLDCEEVVLSPDFATWWREYSLVNNIPTLDVPNHIWRWDNIGLEHTDPSKVANALVTLHSAGYITDRDIQEGRFNRNVEDWQEDIVSQIKFRQEQGLPLFTPDNVTNSSKSSEADSNEGKNKDTPPSNGKANAMNGRASLN